MALEKEALYQDIKAENDQLAHEKYRLQRAIEEIGNEKRIVEGKWKQCEALARQREEDNRLLRANLDKAEAIARVT